MCDQLLSLKRRFRDSQIVIITNFVIVSSVDIKRVVCNILKRNECTNAESSEATLTVASFLFFVVFFLFIYSLFSFF